MPAAAPSALRGGAKTHLEPMLPHLKGPADMRAEMDFFFVSAHATSDPARFIIVPDNTFVFFLGYSGTTRWVGKKQYDALDKLLTPEAWEGSEEAYFKALYDDFIGGGKKIFRVYPGARIYVPGDLIPEHHMSYKSDTQHIWKKGTYKLPLRPGFAEGFLLGPGTAYIHLIAKGLAEGVITREMVEAAKPRAGREKEVEKFLSLEDPLAPAFSAAYYFERPEVFTKVTDDLLTRDSDNLEADMHRTDHRLSKTLADVRGAAPLRFFLFAGCRGVDGLAISPDPEYAVKDPANIDPASEFGKSRRTMAVRRASFAAAEDLCAAPGTPTFNLERLRAAYAEMKNAKVGTLLWELGDPHLREFVSEYTGIFFERGGFVSYVKTCGTREIAELIDRSFMKFPGLQTTKPKFQGIIAPIQTYIRELHQAFKPYIGSLLGSLPITNQKTPGAAMLHEAEMKMFPREWASPELNAAIRAKAEAVFHENITPARRKKIGYTFRPYIQWNTFLKRNTEEFHRELKPGNTHEASNLIRLLRDEKKLADFLAAEAPRVEQIRAAYPDDPEIQTTIRLSYDALQAGFQAYQEKLYTYRAEFHARTFSAKMAEMERVIVQAQENINAIHASIESGAKVDLPPIDTNMRFITTEARKMNELYVPQNEKEVEFFESLDATVTMYKDAFDALHEHTMRSTSPPTTSAGGGRTRRRRLTARPYGSGRDRRGWPSRHRARHR